MDLCFIKSLLESKQDKVNKLGKRFPEIDISVIINTVDRADKLGFDLFQYNNWEYLIKALDDKESRVSSVRKKRKAGKELVFSNDSCSVYWIKNYEACSEYSSRGHWCITNPDGWDEYATGYDRYGYKIPSKIFIVSLKKQIKDSPFFVPLLIKIKKIMMESDEAWHNFGQKYLPVHGDISFSKKQIEDIPDNIWIGYIESAFKNFVVINQNGWDAYDTEFDSDVLSILCKILEIPITIFKD